MKHESPMTVVNGARWYCTEWCRCPLVIWVGDCSREVPTGGKQGKQGKQAVSQISSGLQQWAASIGPVKNATK